MPGLLPDVDPDGLLEYSVVYTDRSLNHMSKRFQGVMRDLSATLKRVYNAHSVAIVPGSGTFGMEAVARQFATGAKCLVIRNGWFSYRWTQIFDMGPHPSAVDRAQGAPACRWDRSRRLPRPPIDEVVAMIASTARQSCSRRMSRPRPA
jgi:aspartate aminotransferase-like enzyme